MGGYDRNAMTDDNTQSPSLPPASLPKTRISRLVQPFARFFRIESSSGILLLACTAAALALANSPWSASFAAIWKIELRLGVGDVELSESLLHFINDGLMALFFFVVGLEIKREIVHGELRDPRSAALPIVAALGGMVAPAGIYLLLQSGQPGHSGWGIPVATDIAFVAGFLTLFGARVPGSLKTLLMSLAIADDLGAILLIAVFYSKGLAWLALGLAAAGLGLMYLLNRLGVRQVSIYVVIGAGVWLAFLKSGVHPTVAGVLIGFLTPAKAWVGTPVFPNLLTNVFERLLASSEQNTPKHRQKALARMVMVAREGTSPLERLEFALHPWVAFVIMPIFAFANAGVAMNVASLKSPIAFAVAAGLVIGKPVGIVVFSWIATRVGLARLPSDVNWKIVLGAAFLCGIGFTMSIFIAGLALPEELLDQGKIGTLAGSVISAVLGCVVLYWFLPSKAADTTAED